MPKCFTNYGTSHDNAQSHKGEHTLCARTSIQVPESWTPNERSSGGTKEKEPRAEVERHAYRSPLRLPLRLNDQEPQTNVESGRGKKVTPFMGGQKNTQKKKIMHFRAFCLSLALASVTHCKKCLHIYFSAKYGRLIIAIKERTRRVTIHGSLQEYNQVGILGSKR